MNPSSSIKANIIVGNYEAYCFHYRGEEPYLRVAKYDDRGCWAFVHPVINGKIHWNQEGLLYFDETVKSKIEAWYALRSFW